MLGQSGSIVHQALPVFRLGTPGAWQGVSPMRSQQVHCFDATDRAPIAPSHVT